jgi:hypothetical protein
MTFRIKIITGYTQIPGHPRTPEEYAELGKKLRAVNAPLDCYLIDLRCCWLYQLFQFAKQTPTHAVADNPKKNTLAYHIVQHQKVDTMALAAEEDKKTEVFVWIDFGIFSIPGMTAEIVEDFLDRAANEKGISIPGIWPRSDPISHNEVCWRFCGGIVVCHRNYLFDLDDAIKDEVLAYLVKHNHITFEVNTWARVEQNGNLPIAWYPADHNASMFIGYPQTRWRQ